MRRALRILDPRPRVERSFHPLRRRAARRALARWPIPTSVLFVCTGNICRSPYAAAALHRAWPKDGMPLPPVSSAGLLGPGRPPPPAALQVAARRGLDLASHVSRLVERGALHPGTLILVMEPEQRPMLVERFGARGERVLLLGDLDPLPIHRRAIEDPWNQPEGVFERSYERIDRCVGALAEGLTRRG